MNIFKNHITTFVLAIATGVFCYNGIPILNAIAFDPYRFFLSFSLIIFGGSFFFYRFIRKYFFGVHGKIEIHSPFCYFPLVFSAWYGLGALHLSEYEQTIDKSNYFYYFVGLSAYFIGLLAANSFSSLKAIIFSKHFKESTSPQKPLLNVYKGRIYFILLFLISFIFGIYILSKSGINIGHENFQDSRTDVIKNVSGYFYYLSLMASDLIILIIIWKIATGNYVFKSKLITLLIILACFLYLILLGSRTRVIYPIFVPLVFFHIYSSKKKSMFFMLSLIFLPIFIIIFGAYRYVSGTSDSILSYAHYVFLGEISLISNAFARIIRFFPSPIEFLGLKVLYQPFLTLLPGNQLSIVDYLKIVLNLDYSGGGFTPSLLGGFYIIDGLPSIIFGMFGIGFFSGWLFKKINESESQTILNSLIYSYWLVYSLNILKGGFLKDIEPIFHIAILFLSIRFLTTNKPIQL